MDDPAAMPSGAVAIGGKTRVGFIVGTPIKQVKTPEVFNRWARQSGRDLVLLPLEIEAAGIAGFFEAMRSWTNCYGCVVTFPFKQAAAAHVDERSRSADFLSACNTVRREASGRLVGDITDGRGFVGALQTRDVAIAGIDVLLIGAGGAGSAIAYELARHGAGRLTIIDLDEARAALLGARLADEFPGLTCFSETPADFRFDVVCNATPTGMNGDSSIPYPLDRVPQAATICDIVPDPPLTPWLLQARDRGHAIQTGPEMVACQLDFLIAHMLQETA